MTTPDWHGDNSIYYINVSHTVVAPGTRGPPLRYGHAEVEFVLEKCFLPYAEYDPSARTVTTLQIEAPLSELASLDVDPSNLTTSVLDYTMMLLQLPECCVQAELIEQLTLEARDAELDFGSDTLGHVLFSVNITLHDYRNVDQVVLEESFQEGARSVRPFRATEESIKGLERFVIGEYDDQETCMVCMDAVEPRDDVRGARIPCGHVYHENCIVKWLGQSCSCPICSYQLPSYHVTS